jgi:hypothetical protein
VARAAGLIAVAVLPVAAGITGDSYLHEDELAAGFHRALVISAVACVVGGLLAAATIRNPARPAVALRPHRQPPSCALACPPASEVASRPESAVASSDPTVHGENP